MTTTWPHESPYAEAAARLRDAITVAALRDVINQAATQMGTTARDHVANNHTTNIRDTIDTLTSERSLP